MKQNVKIYIDKDQQKGIIVADREFLMDIRAACIAYCCHWIKQSKEAVNETTAKKDREISNKYSEYYDLLFDATEQIIMNK